MKLGNTGYIRLVMNEAHFILDAQIFHNQP